MTVTSQPKKLKKGPGKTVGLVKPAHLYGGMDVKTRLEQNTNKAQNLLREKELTADDFEDLSTIRLEDLYTRRLIMPGSYTHLTDTLGLKSLADFQRIYKADFLSGHRIAPRNLEKIENDWKPYGIVWLDDLESMSASVIKEKRRLGKKHTQELAETRVKKRVPVRVHKDGTQAIKKKRKLENPFIRQKYIENKIVGMVAQSNDPMIKLAFMANLSDLVPYRLDQNNTLARLVKPSIPKGDKKRLYVVADVISYGRDKLAKDFYLTKKQLGLVEGDLNKLGFSLNMYDVAAAEYDRLPQYKKEEWGKYLHAQQIQERKRYYDGMIKDHPGF